MAQKTIPLSKIPSLTTLRDCRETSQERRYFDSSSKPCAYRIRGRLSYEGGECADALGVVQLFNDKYDPAALAAAEKGGLGVGVGMREEVGLVCYCCT